MTTTSTASFATSKTTCSDTQRCVVRSVVGSREITPLSPGGRRSLLQRFPPVITNYTGVFGCRPRIAAGAVNYLHSVENPVYKLRRSTLITWGEMASLTGLLKDVEYSHSCQQARHTSPQLPPHGICITVGGKVAYPQIPQVLLLVFMNIKGFGRAHRLLPSRHELKPMRSQDKTTPYEESS